MSGFDGLDFRIALRAVGPGHAIRVVLIPIVISFAIIILRV